MCVGGRCAIAIDRGEEHPYSVVVDATRMYWSRTFTAGAASIRVAPLAGGPASDLFTGLNTPHTLVRDDRNLYWTQITDNGGIWRAPLDGSALPAQIASLQAQPHGLAIDGANLYWTNFAGTGEIPADTIVKMPLAGGAPQVLASNQNDAASPSHVAAPNNLAVDDRFVYWTNWREFGSVMRVPIAGGTPECIAGAGPECVVPVQTFPYGIAVDRRNLYWTTNGTTSGGTVMKQPLDGGPAVTLARNQIAPPFTIAVDDTWVYWSNYDATGKGALMKVRIDGSGDPIALIEAESYGFAVDATSIYWTNYERGTVWKLTPK
jgi:hypothetical protein